jgi:cell division protein FtsB
MSKETNLESEIEDGMSTKSSRFKSLGIAIKKKLTLKLLNKLLIFSISVLGVYYCAGINDLTVKGFEMQELSKKLTKLEEENKQLENESLTLKSMANVNERMKNLRMVAVGENVDYYVAGSGLVARR